MKKALNILVVLACIALSIWTIGCKKDSFTTAGNSLTLRLDTLFFDTVFTSFGQGIPLSVNKQLVVVNPYDEKVRARIALGSERESFFRLNVNGKSGPVHENIVILPRDSVFVFLELYAEENADPKSRPLIIRDSLVVTQNGLEQDVKLIAWGQDANYFRDSILPCNTNWSDQEKPYVIHGFVGVESGCELRINEGVKVYLAPNSWIISEGRIFINGSAESKVVIQGDRLQPEFEEVPGQWGGIRLSDPSANNRISHAIIKNGLVGVFCDSITRGAGPSCVIESTHIRNMFFDGIAGKASRISVTNSVVNNCGRFTFFGYWGGEYELVHSTFAMYPGDFGRNDPTFVLNNIQRDEDDQVVATYNLSSVVVNSIIEGSEEEEIGTDITDQGVNVALSFSNSMLRTEMSELSAPSLKNKINSNSVCFLDRFRNYFELDSCSEAIDAGRLLNPPVSQDFIGSGRTDGLPDMGAFEFQP